MFFFKKRSRVSVQDPFEKFSLDLSNLKRRSGDLNTEQLKINLFHIIRRFYSRLLHVKYSTTFEEISEELKNKKRIPYEIKRKLIYLNKKITHFEYSPEIGDKNTYLQIIDEFLSVLNQLHLHEKNIKKDNVKNVRFRGSSFFHLILKLFNRRVTALDIEKMIIKAYSFLDMNKIDEAEKIYNKIKKNFDLLSERDKEKVKIDILNLFLDIKKSKGCN